MLSSLPSLTLIGCGHMGSALAQAWLPLLAQTSHMHVVEPHADRREIFALQGATTHATWQEAPVCEGVVVLAIKPQSFPAMLPDLARAIASKRPLLISIMAGIPFADLQTLSPRAVRVMPNTPALIGKGMSVAFSPHLSVADHGVIAKLFNAVGSLAWVQEESQMHAVTALSGSGPAYMFAMLEGLEASGIELGLSPALAKQLAVETMLGSAALAAHSALPLHCLREQVTSPNGTTEAGLKALFEEGVFFERLHATVAAAAARSEELATRA